jgi:hypothetical protein
MELIKVVVHYADGRVVKGFTNNFFPNRPAFHLHPAGAGPADKGSEVRVSDLKAVFFVKDFQGDPAYNEKKTFIEGQSPAGRKVEVTFADGEVLVGATLGYDASRPGFFIVTPDPESNNLRVFVVTASMKGLRYL